jgi:hypothetical protein
MPRVGYEPKTPGFERAKTVHALDPAATVAGFTSVTPGKFCVSILKKVTTAVCSVC